MALDATLDVSMGRRGVEFALTVSNASTEPVELAFRSGFVADFAVFEDDEEVWRWSDDRVFTQAIATETLTPGESFTQTGTWEDHEPGRYEVEATLATTGERVVARTPFDV